MVTRCPSVRHSTTGSCKRTSASLRTFCIEALKELSRPIEVGGTASDFGTLRLTASESQLTHKNKYGQDYPAADPNSSVYAR